MSIVSDTLLMGAGCVGCDTPPRLFVIELENWCLPKYCVADQMPPDSDVPPGVPPPCSSAGLVPEAPPFVFFGFTVVCS